MSRQLRALKIETTFFFCFSYRCIGLIARARSKWQNPMINAISTWICDWIANEYLICICCRRPHKRNFSHLILLLFSFADCCRLFRALLKSWFVRVARNPQEKKKTNKNLPPHSTSLQCGVCVIQFRCRCTDRQSLAATCDTFILFSFQFRISTEIRQSPWHGLNLKQTKPKWRKTNFRRRCHQNGFGWDAQARTKRGKSVFANEMRHSERRWAIEWKRRTLKIRFNWGRASPNGHQKPFAYRPTATRSLCYSIGLAHHAPMSICIDSRHSTQCMPGLVPLSFHSLEVQF